jgi:hypothetical protein
MRRILVAVFIVIGTLFAAPPSPIVRSAGTGRSVILSPRSSASSLPSPSRAGPFRPVASAPADVSVPRPRSALGLRPGRPVPRPPT